MKLEGKRVLVFGAGISGIGAADLLCKVGACPVIYDGNDKQDPEAIKARLEQPENVDIILGELSEEARKITGSGSDESWSSDGSFDCEDTSHTGTSDLG